jgi:hypothetical protein
MIYNMPNKTDNPFKWNRWLGFIQGVCFTEGLLTLDEMKKANKVSLNNGLSKATEVIELRAHNVLGVPLADDLDDWALRLEAQ